MKKRSHVGECALKGALAGAAVLGVCGFITGIVLLATASYPIPTFITFEAGILSGGLLGAMVGAITAWRVGRCLLLGLLASGLLLGAAVLLLETVVTWTNLGRVIVIGVMLGLNAHLVVGRQPPKVNP